jgi:phosphate starvation-inducible PhoH-like protein
VNTPSRVTAEIPIEPPHVVAALFGPSNETLRLLAKSLDLELGARGNVVRAVGEPDAVALVERLLGEAAELLAGGLELAPTDIVRGLDATRADASVRLRDLFEDVVLVTARRRPIRAKTIAQRRYVQAIRSHDLTFGIGPAGTGKTYLAMAMAVRALLDKQVRRIVLARPAVEAGEKLGFLPGDLAEKVNPYLRPLYDALHDMMDPDKAQGLVTRGQIEVAPLAFMRGRTLADSFIILDEAQNATSEQMRMFLTRMGYGSRAVVTGDVTQVDLPHGQRSGLAEARDLLKGTEGISFCAFTDVDVVRHPLVQSIIIAYERRDAALAAQREEREARGEAEPGRERGRGPRGAPPGEQGGSGGRHLQAGPEKLRPAASNPGADAPELRDPPENRP